MALQKQLFSNNAVSLLAAPKKKPAKSELKPLKFAEITEESARKFDASLRESETYTNSAPQPPQVHVVSKIPVRLKKGDIVFE